MVIALNLNNNSPSLTTTLPLPLNPTQNIPQLLTLRPINKPIPLPMSQNHNLNLLPYPPPRTVPFLPSPVLLRSECRCREGLVDSPVLRMGVAEGMEVVDPAERDDC